MSALGRMCLRLAACAALRKTTIVGDNVFDSRIEGVDLSEDIPGFAIAVYTEQDDGDALSSANGGPPFLPEIELILEITAQVRGPVNADGSYIVGTPATDDELESSLDLIETQAEVSLFHSFAPNSELFRRIAKRIKHKSSVRFTDPKGESKLAIRYVTYKTEIDDWLIPVNDASKTGLDRLGEPFATIAKAWPEGSVEREKALAMSQLLEGVTPPAFKGAVVKATIANHSGFVIKNMDVPQ
jgi:hypothetical protein